ncbi:MAG: homocysteine S-methyltransferase family protein, partial [Bdellovibrionales bacterium]|nr:homocysteine S-methyltransferase family protein [Bdellovibrionales bacterium]
SSNSPIVCDGGMGTSLYDKGFYINRSFEELSLIAPEAVREVSRGFKKAGVILLRTNTFAATKPRLQDYNIEDRLEEILKASVKLTREVAGDEAYTLGVMGPLGLILEPLGPTSHQEAQDLFFEVARVLDEEGVDGFNLLSFHDLAELESALIAIRSASKKPILAHVGVQENRKTSYGHSLPEFVSLCEKYDVEVLGLSGDVGPSGMLTCLEILRPLTDRPISLLPNAGLPRFVNGQYIYLCNPDYMGKFAKRFVQAGANLVGGHSGVNEDHIRAISNSLRMTQNLHQSSKLDEVFARIIPPVSDEPKEAVPLEKRSRLGDYLKSGKTVLTVEINSPRGLEFGRFLKHCGELEKGGVQFVNIPDGARASARMSSTHLSSYVSREFNIEPIPHFTTRDRNLLGLQSDLLGAHVNGVRNILAVTGDPPKLGNCPGATGVYDVDAIGLTHILNRMNRGLDLGGTSFGTPTEFVLGVALNPTASNQELELKRF